MQRKWVWRDQKRRKRRGGERVIHEDFLVALENKLQVYITHPKQKEFMKRWQKEVEKKRAQMGGMIRIKEMEERVERREDEIKSQAKVFPSPVCLSTREEIIHQVNGEINQMMERERLYEKMKHLPALR